VLREVLTIRQVGARWQTDYYDTEIGVLLKAINWTIGPGYSLLVHYWPRRVLCIDFLPKQPARCSWKGCHARPIRGGVECRDHELPF
jgi:hypothetical protein